MSEPQPFADGLQPGWYAIAPNCDLVDERRFDRYVDIEAALKAGRIGTTTYKDQLTARYLSPEGWMTDWENQQRRKIEHRLSTGEFMIKDGQVVCAFCHGNCGQCGNTGLTDVNGVSMDAMVYNLQESKFAPNPLATALDDFGTAVVQAAVKDPKGFILNLCFSMGVVLFDGGCAVRYRVVHRTRTYSAPYRRNSLGGSMSPYSQAFLHGYADYFAGKSASPNRYGKGLPEHQDWCDGWDEAAEDDEQFGEAMIEGL